MKTIPHLRPAVLWLASLVAVLGADPVAEPALIRAVRVRATPEWQAMLQKKADVAARDAAGNTALHLAALNHDLLAVEALLAAGAEVDAKNAAEATPLLYGAGHAGIVRALLAKGANPNAASKIRNTPLLIAVAHPQSFEAAKLLLAAGADVRAARADGAQLALARAIGGADRRTIDLLLERGAAENRPGLNIALGTSLGASPIDLVERLLDLGAEPNFEASNLQGHTLNTALSFERLDLARLLIERGADPALRSPRGHSTPPMVWSAYNQAGDPSIARLLVARGVDVNVANDQGHSALAYATRYDPHSELAAYLRSVGAKDPAPPRAKPLPDRVVPTAPAARAALVRERMPAALALLQKSSDAFLDNGFVQTAGCTSCHGQDMPAVAYGLARERGLTIDEASFGRQFAVMLSRWNDRAERARQMTSPVPGAPTAVAYGLWALKAADYPADTLTDAMARWVLRVQKPDGHWDDPTRRPPMEDGTYVATGWLPLSLRDYAPAGYDGEIAAAQAKAARWLAKKEPATHNDAVMQLLGLYWAGAPAKDVQGSAARLLRTQRADGGWSQLPNLESDAWATGSALVALHDGAGLKTTDPVYQRGVAYLLRTQFEDGSWWVKTRTWPFQPHFNSQFPHGRDQWISQGGTVWASIALLYLLEPAKNAAPQPNVHALMATYAKSPLAQKKKTVLATTGGTTASGARIDFTRDIQPLFERSCAGCHDAKKPKGGLAIISREALLKGGASGEPAIAPGYSDDSTLIQYVTGKIEDLEMPPLDRRDKYPPLSAAEVERLRTWIDAGAPWVVTKSDDATPKPAALEE